MEKVGQCCYVASYSIGEVVRRWVWKSRNRSRLRGRSLFGHESLSIRIARGPSNKICTDVWWKDTVHRVWLLSLSERAQPIERSRETPCETVQEFRPKGRGHEHVLRIVLHHGWVFYKSDGRDSALEGGVLVC